MGKPYSLELRERAVAAVIVEERAQAEVARLFGVGLASLERWLASWRAGWDLAAKAGKPGPRGRFDPAALGKLRAQVEATPDARLGDHVHAWQETSGQRVSETTLWRALRALDWIHEKKALRQRRTR